MHLRLLRPLHLALGLFTASVGVGCTLYGDPDDYRTCAEVACGNHASCGDGQCFCDAGYEGNPYTGCQSSQPIVDDSCTRDCGQNAYCSEGACYCELDHVAVCGANAGCLPTSRLCDDTPDCPNAADEAIVACKAPLFQEFLLTDGCADGQDIQWRLYALDRDWVWPDATSTFASAGYNVDVYQIVECFTGETICFAGESGTTKWGFNLDGTGSCDTCCYRCGDDQTLDLGYLTCE